MVGALLMSVNIEDRCQNKVGIRDDDVCYKRFGHRGNCYKSVGLEAEDLAQEVLKLSGHKVVKATIHEDHIFKVDFWVECSYEECPLLTDRDFVPIQFTIDREAAYGRKGQEALRNGTIIVWIAWAELVEWQNAPDEDTRKVMSLKISRQFMTAVSKVSAAIKCLGLKLKTPTCKLVRFETA